MFHHNPPDAFCMIEKKKRQPGTHPSKNITSAFGIPYPPARRASAAGRSAAKNRKEFAVSAARVARQHGIEQS
jgi:hypothetical protein